MRQIYNLMKKDFLLIRKNILIMLLILTMALIPIAKETPGSLLYGVLISVLTLTIYNMISMEKIKQKGHIYIAVTPMSNKNIGFSKILTVIATFIIVTISYIGLSSLNFSKFGKINLSDAIIAFFLIGMFFLIYIPLAFKIGYIKLQMLSFLIIFLTPVIIPFIINNAEVLANIKKYILNLPDLYLVLFSLIFCVIITGITGIVSGNILDKKEY